MLKVCDRYVSKLINDSHDTDYDHRPTTELQYLSEQWAEWDILTSLANYHSVVNILFGYLSYKVNWIHTMKNFVYSSAQQKMSEASRHIAAQIAERLAHDVSAVVRHLTGIFRDPRTYKQFLTFRGTLAQQMLDLLQDACRFCDSHVVLLTHPQLLDSTHDSMSRLSFSKALIRLSRASGLHPTCFELSGLEKVGRQVAAGTFGDVWKGLVHHRSVSVKIARIFQDTDVKDVYKVCI
jgi:hypothetical protein